MSFLSRYRPKRLQSEISLFSQTVLAASGLHIRLNLPTKRQNRVKTVVWHPVLGLDNKFVQFQWFVLSCIC